MMVFGYILVSFFLALGDGSYQAIISQFINASTGEYQIHFKDYLSEPKQYKAITYNNELIKKLNSHESIRSFSPRIDGGALAFLNKKSLGVSLLGVDFAKELASTSIKTRLAKGEFPQENMSNQIVIGRRIVKILKAKLGDKIILISTGADGSIANDIFEVTGIIDQGSAGIDDMNIYMSLDSAQEYLSVWGRVSEVMIRTDDEIDKDWINQIDENLTLSTWKDVEADFYKAMLADRKGDAIGRFIIIILIALGVFNTVLMSILERTREFGVLKAIGTKPSYLFKLIITETLFIGLFSVVIGATLAFIVNYYFSVNGITLDNPIEYGGFRFETMKAAIDVSVFITPAVIIILTSFVVSIFPAFKAGRVIPVEAMRS